MNGLLFMLLLVGGILFLVGDLFLTRITWRIDVEPFGRRSRLFEIARQPEHIAKADRLREIRVLNLLGCILLGASVAILVYDIFSAMRAYL